MSVQFLPVKPSQKEEVFDLWTSVFGVERWRFSSTMAADPLRRARHTRVAVDTNGKILAAVQIVSMRLRDGSGSDVLVGGIANVATLPTARKCGYSGTLLKQAIEVMAADGVAWSMLFTGVNAHYEKYGWQSVVRTDRVGRLRVPVQSPSKWTISQVSGPISNEPVTGVFSRIYRNANATRPLSAVRSVGYWDTKLGRRMERDDFITVVASSRPREPFSAYACGELDGDTLRILELCAVPGCEDAYQPLVAELARRAEATGATSVTVSLPEDDAIQSAAGEAIARGGTESNKGMMIRPISAGTSVESISRLITSPGAHFWPLDGF